MSTIARSASSSTSTILPSIRDLHPYLPDPRPPASQPTSYNYPRSVSDSPPSSTSSRVQSYAIQRHPSDSHVDAMSQDTRESEDEEPEQSDPPRKRRRRQALSCTECKRRKIKCDRAHPCTPCVRRNEQSKCQWHQLEPIEKYATRQEYEDLKMKFEHLEALVRQLAPTIDLNAHGLAMDSHRVRSASVSDTAASQRPSNYHPYARNGSDSHEPPRSAYRVSPPISRAPVPRYIPNSVPTSPYAQDTKELYHAKPRLGIETSPVPAARDAPRGKYWTPSDRSTTSPTSEQRRNHSPPGTNQASMT